MRGGGGWSPCLQALGGRRGLRKDRRRMASGNGLPSSSALVAKRPSALGPFPRYIWIHQDTPQDSLDKTCHEIWKRVQGLPEALQPRTVKEQLSAPVAGTPRDNGLSFQEGAPEPRRGKDEISLLVEQEFLSLTQEHLILVTESPPPAGPRLPAPRLPAPPRGAGSTEGPGAPIAAGDTLREPKVAMSVLSGGPDCDSVVSTVTGILRAAKVKSVKGADAGGRAPGAPNSEVGRLLAQIPLKPSATSQAPDTGAVQEHTRAIKEGFLQNGTLGGPGPRDALELGSLLLLPPLPAPLSAPPDKLPELPAQKRQLPVFAKICSQPEADAATEGRPLVEWNPGTKEPTKGRESLFLSQWPQTQKDTCGEEGCSDPGGSVSVALSAKKSMWPAEKNLLYEFLGVAKNPSGPLKLRSKVEVDGLELKRQLWPWPPGLWLSLAKPPPVLVRDGESTPSQATQGLAPLPNWPVNPPGTVADKSNLKYTGNVFTPRFATALTSATLNQPLWLNLSYPPPPVFTNHSAFPQYQGLYPPRAARMPCQQPPQPPLGCSSRQVTPYSPQQVGQQVFRSSYAPLLSYIPFVQPGYPHPQRTPPKLCSHPRDPSPMAGDGPQYVVPQAYGFGSTAGGPLVNSPYFSSGGNGINF
uniref:Uncharacterized protein n=1 Tax=Canis lupus familiaris TaxID=9615 RepID=A0A8C0QNS3_CANLF